MFPSGIFLKILIPLASSQQNLYDIYLLLFVQCQIPDDGQRNYPKHVEFYSKNKFEKLVHLVGFIIRIRTVGECRPTPALPLPVSKHTTLLICRYSRLRNCEMNRHSKMLQVSFSSYARSLSGLRCNIRIRKCNSIQINHEPDATIFQSIILTFIYSSTCFGPKLTVKTQLVYVWFFLLVCQSDYMFRPQLGHHQVTSRLYNRGSQTL